MSIEVRNITKTFDDFVALNDVSLSVAPGELVALLGPSGSGKTTLLRVIAGLELADPSSGPVLFHDEDVSARGVGHRRVGFVFQHYALFRHMTVAENVAFGLNARPRSARPARNAIKAKVDELLQLVQLERLGARYPSQLSGGQRQRVALARALAIEPRVLLMDEPFGALDAQVRRELRRWLRRLHDQLSVTSLFVTHDQEEALEVADRVVVMNHGRIEQIGTPREVYERPANPFVYRFLGSVNLFHGRLESGRLRVGDTELISPDHSDAPSADAVAYVRPHDVDVVRHAQSDAIRAKVEHVSFAGAVVQVQLTRVDNAQPIDAALTHDRFRELELRSHEEVFIRLRNPQVYLGDYSI